MNTNIRDWFYNKPSSKIGCVRAEILALLGINYTQLFNRLNGITPFTVAEQKLLTQYIGKDIDFDVKPRKEIAI